jgi:hypothetical protein
VRFASVRFGEHLPGKQDQKYDGGGGQRPLGVSLKPLQPGFGLHAAKYRRCAERSRADLENQPVQRVGPPLQHAERHSQVHAVQWLIAKVIAAVQNNESPLR